MTKEYYAYATGSRKKAEQDAKRTFHFVNSKDLEVIIVNITPLVQTGIISEEKLQIRD